MEKWVTEADLDQFDEIVIATGVTPRAVAIEGSQHPKVLTYLQVLKDKVPVGKKVAIIGAGGVGFDTAEYLLSEDHSQNVEAFASYWGIDQTFTHRGGVQKATIEAPHRQIFLLQRSKGKVGERLGKTTGWIHRTTLKNSKVKMMEEVTYRKVDDQGLHLVVKGEAVVLDVDHVVLCAGQEPQSALYDALKQAGKKAHLIGGAFEAKELDAKRAIEQGTILAISI